MKIQLRVLVLLCAAFCAPLMWGMSGDEQKELNEQLYAAADSGNKDRVLELLELKAQVNSVNGWGWTPLLIACSSWGHVEVVELLLANKATVNQANKNGSTPLYGACYQGHAEIAELLVANKAAIDQAAKYGETPLYTACCQGHTKIVELLLANQAVVDQEDKDGKTPLRMVCEKYNKKQKNRRKAIIELLIASGADVGNVEGEQFVGTKAHAVVQACVQASPKGKRKRAKPSGFVDNVHSE